MAYVLAEHPVKHPNYPNGNYYAMWDTDKNEVSYIEDVAINYLINYKDIIFYGNHPLAMKDELPEGRRGKEIIRRVKTVNFGTANLVYFYGTEKIVVEFVDTGNLYACTYKHFVNGQVRDLLKPTIRGVGIVGIKDAHKIYKKCFKHWEEMLARCIGHTGNNCYRDCTISKEFLFFPNFADWYYKQANHDIDFQFLTGNSKIRMEVDKDIILKGNNCYASSYCLLVPNAVNTVLAYSYENKGIYPVGVSFDRTNIIANARKDGKRLKCSIGTKKANSLPNAQFYRQVASTYKGIHNIPEEQWAAVGYCFMWYKIQKEEEIKRVADYWYFYNYRGRTYHCITEICYHILMNWQVGIND